MLVGPYLSHPLTSYMKNAKRYIVKTATASSAIQAIPALHTVDTPLLLGKFLRRSLLICCMSAGCSRKNAGKERKMRREPALLTA